MATKEKIAAILERPGGLSHEEAGILMDAIFGDRFIQVCAWLQEVIVGNGTDNEVRLAALVLGLILKPDSRYAGEREALIARLAVVLDAPHSALHKAVARFSNERLEAEYRAAARGATVFRDGAIVGASDGT